VSQLPAELPKVDWAGLKAKLGDQAPLLTELQKQYDAIKIDFGGVPDKLTKEIDEWTLYNVGA
jgi:hypothetical protein